MKRGLILLLLLIPLVQAVGVTPSSENLNFKPNLLKEFHFNFFPTSSNTDIKIALSGDLSQYATIDKDFLRGGGIVTVKISLPKNLDPGQHYINVRGIENISNTQGISAGTAVSVPIRIFVPYEGKYIEASLEIPNLNVNELGTIKINIKNIGTKAISNLYAKILISDYEKEVKTLETERVPLLQEESKTIESKFSTNNLKQGNYKAIATIFFDNQQEVLEKEFLIGELIVNILNFTETAIEREINKFYITIESKWNNKIENIYADIFLLSGNNVLLETKTLQNSLEPWELKTIDTFLDLSTIIAGNYDIKIILNYNNQQSTKAGKLKVIKSPKLSYIEIILTSIIIVLVSSIIWYYLIRKTEKNRKNAKKS